MKKIILFLPLILNVGCKKNWNCNCSVDQTNTYQNQIVYTKSSKEYKDITNKNKDNASKECNDFEKSLNKTQYVGSGSNIQTINVKANCKLISI